ncbi:hypothetical protein CEE45_13420 [Candidatus Heimdallarchaeota archaeon B3_Heim]|nr:MAG: hypothetical protein CEE45_13420 [Candidatus Heimdallarchaeota archaeon B3_Heim]
MELNNLKIGVQQVKRCVILGTGLIGQQFVRLLDTHPYFELTEVVASDKSEGQSLKSKWNLPSFEIPDMFANLKLSSLRNLTPNSYDIVFSALPASIAKDIELKLAQNGDQFSQMLLRIAVNQKFLS